MGYAEGPHGGSMGVAGGVADRGDVGQSNQKGYDYGFGEAASDTSTIEGFREALAKALGQVTQEQKNAAVEAQNNLDANNRAMAAAVLSAKNTKEQREREAIAGHIKGKSISVAPANAVESPGQPENPDDIEDPNVIDNKGWTSQLDESQFDDNFNEEEVSLGPESPVGAYSGGWADVQTETETSPTDYGTMATEEFDSGPRDRREQISQSIVDRFGMPGNPHQSINLDSPSREALKNNPNMENVAFQDLAFDMVELEMNKTQPSSAVEAIFGFINKAFNPAYGLGALAKSILGGLGFEVDPNLGQRALAAAITAFEGGEIGTKGMGGLMEGERNDGMNSINEEQAMKILTYVEPWVKGLSGKQIKYYFDRPEELKWVRNLWSSMNPTQEESMVIID